MKTFNELQDLINIYWDAAYAEGKEGRDHDTVDGVAGETRAQINISLRELFTEKERLETGVAFHMRKKDELRSMCDELARCLKNEGKAWVDYGFDVNVETKLILHKYNAIQTDEDIGGE